MLSKPLLLSGGGGTAPANGLRGEGRERVKEAWMGVGLALSRFHEVPLAGLREYFSSWFAPLAQFNLQCLSRGQSSPECLSSNHGSKAN